LQWNPFIPKKKLYNSAPACFERQIIAWDVELRGFCFGLQFSPATVTTVVSAFVPGSIFKFWGFMDIDVFNLVLLTC